MCILTYRLTLAQSFVNAAFSSPNRDNHNQMLKLKLVGSSILVPTKLLNATSIVNKPTHMHKERGIRGCFVVCTLHLNASGSTFIVVFWVLVAHLLFVCHVVVVLHICEQHFTEFANIHFSHSLLPTNLQVMLVSLLCSCLVSFCLQALSATVKEKNLSDLGVFCLVEFENNFIIYFFFNWSCGF